MPKSPTTAPIIRCSNNSEKMMNAECEVRNEEDLRDFGGKIGLRRESGFMDC